MRAVEPGFLFEEHAELLEIKRQIELDGLPSDPEDVRCQLCRMIENAENLRILFGGHPDKAAIEDAQALVAVVRAASAKAMGATHVGTTTRN